MNAAIAGVIGVLAGVIGGLLVPRPSTPCKFCGYQDQDTAELFEVEELNKLLEENE